MNGACRQLPDAGYARLFHTTPLAQMVVDSDGLVIAEANEAFLRAVGMTRDIVGRHVFDVFPNSPRRGQGNQATDLRGLFQQVVDTRSPRVVDALRYDIPTDHGFDVRYWSGAWHPVLGVDGRVDQILHQTEDVTDLINARETQHRTQEAAERTAQRMTALAEVSLTLTQAQTLEDIELVVVTRGSRVLGTAGGSILTFDDDSSWRVTLNESVGAHARELYQELPYDSPMPGCHAARTGQPVYLPTRAAGRAFHPVMAEIQDRRQRDAWAFLPLIVGARIVGALSFSWVEEHHVTDDEREVLEALAAQCALAVVRLEAVQNERRTTTRITELAEALQMSMLTAPPHPAGLQIEVRYRTAVDIAQVGGDWYDSFEHADGSTTLVIGDVAGHDHTAAGQMGQMRGLLRALAFVGTGAAAYADHRPGPQRQDPAPWADIGHSPAAILTEFEHTAEALATDHLATAVLARIEPADPTRPGRLLRWSNAGNPPPMLIAPCGDVTVLASDDVQDLILGVDAHTERHDHSLHLSTGSSLVLYTDGLVERRGTPIHERIDELQRVLADAAGLSLDQLCDFVLARMVPTRGEDDIALLAVRVTD